MNQQREESNPMDMFLYAINSDEKLEKIYDNEIDDLNHLKSWIYKKQIGHIKPNLMKRGDEKYMESKNEKLF